MTPDLSAATALALAALDPALGGVAFAGADGWTLEPHAALLAALRAPAGPCLRLPLAVTPDRLLGGLDLDATLRTGRRMDRPGLLAGADGGVLLVPDPDLLQPEIAGPLAAALRRGAVILERDGLSRRYPARALLVTVTSSHAPRYPALLDLAGLRLPAGAGDALPEAHALGAAVQAARAALPQVMIADDQVAALAALALRLAAPGLRGEYVAARAARAIAALAGHTAVELADLELAAAFVLLPRAGAPRAPHPPAPPLRTREDAGEADSGGGEDEASGGEDRDGAAAERLIAAQAALLPPAPEPPAPRHPRAPATGGAGRMTGARLRLPARHGRPGPARAAARRPPGAGLDLNATLEAAAWRLAAAGRAPAPATRLPLRGDDLRWRTPQAPPGVLFIFAVDASGSMARNRLGPAKGAALTLLERAYRRRDRVALISARGAQAELILPPTRSIARARRLLEALPAGGGTPLASALALAETVATRAAAGGYGRALLVLLTDGRGNVPLAAPATPEGLAGEIAALGTRWAGLAARGQAGALVIDTRLRFVGGGEATALATALGGDYLYLPHLSPEAIGAAAEAAAVALGWRGDPG